MNTSKKFVLLIICWELLGKYKHAEVPLPGGCNIGSRPIDQHLKGFRALGATVEIKHGAIVARAENMHGSHIFLDMVSVGATINIMMAAAMAPAERLLRMRRESSCRGCRKLFEQYGGEHQRCGYRHYTY